MRFLFLLFISFALCGELMSQTPISGKIFDATNKEAVVGAVISDGKQVVLSDASGSFKMVTNDTSFTVSCIGYINQKVELSSGLKLFSIALKKDVLGLEQVVVSANRTIQKRVEAPIAISVIDRQTIEETKAQRFDYLLNKVSGANMISLGNEQNKLSIRQPITPNNVLLFLEDGIPIRTPAVYNHNAMIELNMAAVQSIEIIKGASSALYGAEAIAGVVNTITKAPPVFTSGYASVQMNNRGYKRTDAQIGSTKGKVGFIINGYYANQHNGVIEYSDFHKLAVSSRLDYHIDSATTWTNSVSYVNYYTDMYGGLDSIHFASKNYETQKLFPYRKVLALRGRSSISHQWNVNSTTSASFVYRKNTIDQNPSYAIASYHMGGIATNLISSDTATGNTNVNSFNSYGLYLQHVQKFNFLNSKLIVGANAEVSPQEFRQSFIWVRREGGNYPSYTQNNPDSLQASNKTLITNVGTFMNFDFTLARGLRFSTALRYDAFSYSYVNYLPNSVVGGGPSNVANYNKITPKVGFTYNIHNIGFYGNYSQGYVPPQITEAFGQNTGIYLRPQNYYNYEIGGWLSLVKKKLYLDWSSYVMNGKDEIVILRMPDGTNQSENAGQTSHIGIEYGANYKPTEEWILRISGTNSRHKYINYVSGTVVYNGHRMSAAPSFVANAEIIYKPRYINGFRIGAEMQHIGPYFEDNLNTHTYEGYNLFNLRAGFSRKWYEVWLNVLNLFDKYYSTLVTYNPLSGYNYPLGDPRAFTVGLSYKFGR